MNDFQLIASGDLSFAAQVIIKRARHGTPYVKWAEGEEQPATDATPAPGFTGWLGGLARQAGTGAGNAFANYGGQKLQGWGQQAAQMWNDNPALQYGAYGAGIGGLLGLGSGLIGRKKRPISSLLSGALMGGAAGAGGKYLYDQATKPSEPAPAEPTAEQQREQQRQHLNTRGTTRLEAARVTPPGPARDRLTADANADQRNMVGIDNAGSLVTVGKKPDGTPIQVNTTALGQGGTISQLPGEEKPDDDTVAARTRLESTAPAEHPGNLAHSAWRQLTGQRVTPQMADAREAPDTLARTSQHLDQLPPEVQARLTQEAMDAGYVNEKGPNVKDYVESHIDRPDVLGRNIVVDGHAPIQQTDPSIGEDLSTNRNSREALQNVAALYGTKRVLGGIHGARVGYREQAGPLGPLGTLGRTARGALGGAIAGTPLNATGISASTGYDPRLMDVHRRALAESKIIRRGPSGAIPLTPASERTADAAELLAHTAPGARNMRGRGMASGRDAAALIQAGQGQGWRPRAATWGVRTALPYAAAVAAPVARGIGHQSGWWGSPSGDNDPTHLEQLSRGLVTNAGTGAAADAVTDTAAATPGFITGTALPRAGAAADAVAANPGRSIGTPVGAAAGYGVHRAMGGLGGYSRMGIGPRPGGNMFARGAAGLGRMATGGALIGGGAYGGYHAGDLQQNVQREGWTNSVNRAPAGATATPHQP